MNSENLLEVNNVSKVYDGQIEALHPLSFALKKGESLALIGKNGSGKTTFLKILSGITKPTTGNILIRGKVISILELGSGFHPDLKGNENIWFGSNLLGYSKKEISKVYNQIVLFSGLDDALNRKIKSYSNGMLLRLAFSVFVHLPADIFLLDEVLQVGDKDFQLKCNTKLTELRERGISIIMANHNINALNDFVDYGLLFEERGFAFNDIYTIQEKYLLGDETFNKRQNKWKSKEVSLINISTSQNQVVTNRLNSDRPIDVIVKFVVYQNDLDLNFFLNVLISDFPLIISSEIFNKNENIKTYNKGIHKIVCTIPANLLNRGMYFINFWFGNEERQFLLVENATSFQIQLPDWELKRKWVQDDFRQPIRPNFNWKRVE